MTVAFPIGGNLLLYTTPLLPTEERSSRHQLPTNSSAEQLSRNAVQYCLENCGMITCPRRQNSEAGPYPLESDLRRRARRVARDKSFESCMYLLTPRLEAIGETSDASTKARGMVLARLPALETPEVGGILVARLTCHHDTRVGSAGKTFRFDSGWAINQAAFSTLVPPFASSTPDRSPASRPLQHPRRPVSPEPTWLSK